MKKLSKIKTVQGSGTWSGKDGTLFYKYDYVMEDGAAFQASHKDQDKFSPGDEVEYEITGTHPTYGANGKVSKPNNYQGGGFKSKGASSNIASFALSYAKDMAGFHISQGKEFGSTEVIKVADVFLKWLKENQ